MQFRIVLLLWADLLPSLFKSRDDGTPLGIEHSARCRRLHRLDDDERIVWNFGHSFLFAIEQAVAEKPYPAR
jgi:hypothetical protein